MPSINKILNAIFAKKKEGEQEVRAVEAAKRGLTTTQQFFLDRKYGGVPRASKASRKLTRNRIRDEFWRKFTK